MSLAEITTPQQLLEAIKGDAMPSGNLSIRGVARLVGVQNTSIARGVALKSQKLTKKLAMHGFEGVALTRKGFPVKAVILVLDYYANEAQVVSTQAKTLMLTFGMLGLAEVLNKLNPSEIAIAEINQKADSMSAMIKTVGLLGVGLQEVATVATTEIRYSQQAIQTQLASNHQQTNQHLSMVADDIGCRLDRIEDAIADMPPQQVINVNPVAEKQPRNPKSDRAFCFAVPDWDKYDRWAELADKSGMSRSRFFYELVNQVLEGSENV